MRILLTICLVLLAAGPAFAAELESADTPPWWEMVGGILAIPAAALGLAYSYILIRKTRLEARKTELEIVEKETALQKLATAQPEAAREIVRPIVEGRQSQYFVLRFVLLYVVLQLWSLAQSAFRFIIGGFLLGAQQALGFDLDNAWVLIPFYVLQNLPQVVSWIIVIGIGWPLFQDLNAFLNLDLKAILTPWRKKDAA